MLKCTDSRGIKHREKDLFQKLVGQQGWMRVSKRAEYWLCHQSCSQHSCAAAGTSRQEQGLTVCTHLPRAGNVSSQGWECLCSHPFFRAAETAESTAGLGFGIWHRPPMCLIPKGSKKKKGIMPQRCLCAKTLYFIHLVRLGLQKEGKALWEQNARTQPHEASYIARASEITRWGTRFEAFTTVRMFSQEFQVLLPTLCHGLCVMSRLTMLGVCFCKMCVSSLAFF